MDFITNRKKFFIASICIILIGLLAMPFQAFKGNGILNYDIEFSGGSVIQLEMGQQVDIPTDIRPIVQETLGDDSPRIQEVIGTTQIIITTKETTTAQRKELLTQLKEKYNLEDSALLGEESLSPTISQEIKSVAVQAITLVAVLMLIYISIRFKDVKFGTSAVIALLHDVLIMFAVYSVFRVPINNSFIAAMLTIIGYSINDTIIVFDRIRENKGKMKGKDIEIINASIGQTMTRSINTSITTLIMVGMLLAFGLAFKISSITEFAFPLVIGVLSGTYSSIFVASPVWYELRKYSKKKVAKSAK